MVEIEFTNYKECIDSALSGLKALEILASQKTILIKPNLVNESPPPVTTPADICRATAQWLRENTNAEIILAEGSGSLQMDTLQVFEELGYGRLSRDMNIPLVDLNEVPTVTLADASCSIFPEFHMPKIIMESYLISVPVLKAHSLAQITGAMKSMVGCAPPRHYQADGHWKKSAFHSRTQQSIVELNRYRTPDLSIIDATIGLADYHLGGPECDPPVNKILAGFDPLELDRRAAALLGMDWKSVPHLCD